MTAVKTTTERLLEMIVMVGIADRLHAMSLRDTKGDEAAIEYLRDCTISSEDYGPRTWRPELRVIVDNTLARRAPDQLEPEHAQ